MSISTSLPQQFDDPACEDICEEHCESNVCELALQSPSLVHAIDVSGSLLGLRRVTDEEMYQLYCGHAAELGFSVRKYSTKYNSSKVLVSKDYVSSCEGMRRPTPVGAKKRDYISRTGCKAGLRIKLIDEMYEVVRHTIDHNHLLTRKTLNYMHRSRRSITSEKVVIIEDLMSSGIRPVDSFRYMAHDAGGEHLLGHTKVDHFNFINRLKMTAIESEDGQTLINTLQQAVEEDPTFFFRVRLDEEGRLCNVFWRDGMMREDYKIFGDVVVFDTTYRTNRYNLICAPFVGINNHRRNVMFGCAFIANEKIESFEWLFDVFRKSMAGHAPVTIFTDQDHAIASALETIFPTTRHRLCIWHLYQNAIARFGKLKSNGKFNELFQKCISGCTDAMDFETSWSTMISNYGLKDNPWFDRLYSLREKWCTAYNNDFFSAGILSSQRSEVTNHALCFSASKTTSLNDFYNIFLRTVQRWRSTELSDEFHCSKSIPTSCLGVTGLLKHASEVYTLTVFRIFENEFLKSISISIRLVYEESDTKVYEVKNCDDNLPTAHIVYYYLVGSLVTCSCKKFDKCGILCYHCLRVLHLHSIAAIPECYIIGRWGKFCKKHLWDKFDRGDNSEKLEKHSWRNKMLRISYNLISKAEDKKEARLAIEDAFASVLPFVESLVTEDHVGDDIDDVDDVDISTSSRVVLDPSHSITKGRKARRIKSRHRSKKLQSVTASTSNISRDFGSKTPNDRLF